MEAIVLAGGLGTRLRPVIADLPKPLAPVAGRPFLSILLHDLSRHGFTTVVMAVGYKHELITAEFGSAFAGMEIRYAVEDFARWDIDYFASRGICRASRSRHACFGSQQAEPGLRDKYQFRHFLK